MTELDPRIGVKAVNGLPRKQPKQTISGRALPPKPYTTIGLDDSYFVVLDQFIDSETRDALILELRGVVKNYRVPASKTAKESGE